MPQQFPDKPPLDYSKRDAALARRRAQGVDWTQKHVGQWKWHRKRKGCGHQWHYGERDAKGEATMRRCIMPSCRQVERWLKQNTGKHWRWVIVKKGDRDVNA